MMKRSSLSVCFFTLLLLSPEALAQEITGVFLYPVGGASNPSPYRIDQGFNNSYEEGYCSIGSLDTTPSECLDIFGVWRYGHDGIDLNRGSGNDDCGDPVFAAGLGKVVSAGSQSGWGNLVRIQHNTLEGYRYTVYGHLQDVNVVFGQNVVLGQQVGTIGNGGVSTHCHLHFGVLTENVLGQGYYYGNMPDNHLNPVTFIADHTAPPYRYAWSKSCGWVSGGEETGWVYTCEDERSVFFEGESPYVLVKIEDISADHCFRTRIYKLDLPFTTYTDGPWCNTVGGWWDRAYSWPHVTNIGVGDWQFEIDINVNGGPFQHVDTRTISVWPSPVGPPPPYQYSWGKVCHDVGGPDTNWNYWCVGEASQFNSGDTVSALMRIEDIWEDHCFMARVYRNGDFQWQTGSWCNDINEQWGWSQAYSWTTINNIWPGSWAVEFYVKAASDTGYWRVDTKYFTVN